MSSDEPTTQPLAVSPEEAARLLGIGRTHVVNLLRTGKLPSKKIGRRTLIRRGDLEAFLNGLPEEPR